jgi:hypothetical protein
MTEPDEITHYRKSYSFACRRFFARVIQIAEASPASNPCFYAKAFYRGGWHRNDLVDDTPEFF